MANKFQKSVQERLEQETARETPQENIQTTVSVSRVSEHKKPLKENPTVRPQSKASGFEAYLEENSRRSAKNKTFYLDTEVIEALKNAAVRQKVPESRLVNGILKKVLMG